MPSKHELVKNVASKFSHKSDGEACFTNLDLNTAYSQLNLDVFTS